MKTLLETYELNSFYDKAQILFNINFRVSQGELVAVIGRNGVGKTTLLKSIMNIEVVKRGRIKFDDIDITNLPTYRIASIGISYVPDYTGLIPGISVLDNLRLSAGKKNVNLSLAKELYDRIDELLPKKADTLSGGERKIVGVIRALLMNPRLVLLDEPTEGVGPIVAKRIYELVSRMKDEGLTVVVVEQGTRFSHVKNIADRISVMVNGRIMYETTRDKVDEEMELIQSYLAMGATK
jgi:branched-chain amino acid transport system ATP-binding protein/urea transport system ATP-binding protein